MSPLRRWGGRARAVPQLGRIAASVAVERLRPVRSDDPTVAPTRVADLVLGDGARDLAYALSTVLVIEDRRAWEDDLLALYREELHRRGGPPLDPAALRRRYRAQLWGALAFWAPTFSPPRLMPGDMQPREVSGEMLRRIGTACLDHDAFAAVAA